MLAGAWLALGPAPAGAHGTDPSGDYSPQVRPQGETGNYCNNTRTYAANGGANTVDLRIVGGIATDCRASAAAVHTTGWNWRRYAIKVAAADADDGGSTGAIEGANIEYVSGIRSGTGSWRSVPGAAYNFRCVGGLVGCGGGLETGQIGRESGSGPMPDLRIRFTVPASYIGAVKLVFTIAVALGGGVHEHHSMVYGDPKDLDVHPLAVPQNSAGTPQAGSVSANTRTYAADGAAQRARIYLRAAPHSNRYISSQFNAEPGGFDSATIKVAGDGAGANAISGAKISSDADGDAAIGACTETSPGNTCTITSANFPQYSGTPPRTTWQDIYFSVPSTHRGAAYLTVTAAKSGKTPRTFAARYDQPRVGDEVPLVRLTTPGRNPGPGTASIYSGSATTASAYLATLDGENSIWKPSVPAEDLPTWQAGGAEWSRYLVGVQSPAFLEAIADFPISAGEMLYVGREPGEGDVALRGRPIGINTQVQTAGGAPIKFANLDSAALRLTAANGTIVHEQLCPRIVPEHPLDGRTMTAPADCTIMRADLMAFQQATAEDAVQALDFAYIAASASTAGGAVRAVWSVGGNAYDESRGFAHVQSRIPAPLEVSVFLDWADPGADYWADAETNYATAGPTAMFTIGRSGTEVDEQALPSGLAWARFNELEDSGTAVRLSIDRGTISYNGEQCVKNDDGPCLLSLLLWELRQERGAAVTDLIGNLRVGYALPIGEPATLTVEAWPDGETEPISATLQLGSPAAGAPVASVTLPDDADRLLAPGQTAAIAAGFTVPVDASGDVWACAGFGPSFLELTAPLTLVNGCPLTRSTPPAALTRTQRWLSDESYLVISGPATFEENGDTRLDLGGAWNNLNCAAAGKAGAAAELGIACWATDADGNRPKITVDAGADEDVRVFANLAIDTAGDRTLRLFTGAGQQQPLDRFAEAAAFDFDLEPDESFFGRGTFSVGAVRELDRISLTRAPINGIAPTGPVAASSNQRLLLSILNENGIAARLGALSSITVLAGSGTLSGYGCEGATSCVIPTAAGDLAEAAADNPAVIAAIELTYKPPAELGPASLVAAVVGADGASLEQTLELEVAGAAAALNPGGATPIVHSSATDDDDRDQIKIPITALDAGGNAARMPSNARAAVAQADGAALPADSHTAVVECTDEARRNCEIIITVIALPASPLTPGAYIARVAGTGITAAEAGFNVAGPAETVALEIPDQPGGLGEAFAVTARVADAAGNAVADGTWVAFSASAAQPDSRPLVLASPPLSDHDGDAATAQQRRARTKDGAAAANAVVIGRGVALLTASASGKSILATVNLSGVETASAAPYVEMSGGAASGPAFYRGSTTSSAAEVLALGPEGATTVWLWNGLRWLRYSETDGQSLPGSVSFTVYPGDFLWFSGS